MKWSYNLPFYHMKIRKVLHTDPLIGNKYYKKENCNLQLAFQKKELKAVPKIISGKAAHLRFEL